MTTLPQPSFLVWAYLCLFYKITLLEDHAQAQGVFKNRILTHFRLKPSWTYDQLALFDELFDRALAYNLKDALEK